MGVLQGDPAAWLRGVSDAETAGKTGRMEQDETISLIFKMILRCEYRSGPMKVKESGQFSPVPSITSSSSRLRS